MTSLVSDGPAEMAAELPGATRRRILFYLAGLFVLIGFANPSGGLIALPISFFLKNKLHLAAHQVAFFSLCAHIPVYFAFAFGFARDTWSPFGKGDRGFLMIFAPSGPAPAWRSPSSRRSTPRCSPRGSSSRRRSCSRQAPRADWRRPSASNM